MGNHHSSVGRAERTYEFASPTKVHQNHRHHHHHHHHHHLNPSDCFGKREEEEEECCSCSQTFGVKSISSSKSSKSTHTRLRILPKRRRNYRTTRETVDSVSFYLEEQQQVVVESRSKGRGAGASGATGQPTFYPGGKTKKLHTSSSSTGTSPEESPQQDNNQAPKQTPKMTTQACNIEKFAKILHQQSKLTSPSKHDHHHGISREAFQKHVMRHSPICAAYLWDYYNGWSDGNKTLKTSCFVQRTEKLFGAITDKEQASFYVKLYSKDKDSIDRSGLLDLLVTSYQLSPSASGDPTRRDLLSSSMDFEGKEWMESVSKSCFHMKELMSVFYVANWLSTNMPRIFAHIHKYIVHQLTTGYTRLSREKETTREDEARGSTGEGQTANWSPNQEQVTGISSVFMWLLSVSIPEVFLASLEKKEDSGGQEGIKQLLRMQSRDLLAHLTSSSHPKWTQLYDSLDQGLSINRFQYHVFNYRGPTLLFLKCDNDYEILVGIDCEWKENCHFWGGKSCFITQLKPEFRLVEMGEKSLYANFSIRGYPFGVQVGQDPRNVSLKIHPDFEHVDFKKIPSRIISLTVWGCGSQDTKTAQAEHKKWEAKESEKQKKININTGDWKDNPDKYLLELGGNYKSYGG